MTPLCRKQSMMLLEEVLVCGGVSFHPLFAVPSRRKGSVAVTVQRSAGVANVTFYLISSVLGGVKSARRLVISTVRFSTKRNLLSGVTLVSPLGCRTKGLPR